MSEPQMSHSQALQELTRFENMWQAANKLKEALQVAAVLERSVERLQAEEIRLGGVVKNAEASAEAAKKVTQQEIAKAEAESNAKLKHLMALNEKREKEYTDLLAKRERETKNAIAHLEKAVLDKRKEMNVAFNALNEEIAHKQALVTDLNNQLDELRRRLGLE